jgi:hypothetical protein
VIDGQNSKADNYKIQVLLKKFFIVKLTGKQYGVDQKFLLASCVLLLQQFVRKKSEHISNSVGNNNATKSNKIIWYYWFGCENREVLTGKRLSERKECNKG